MKYTPMEPGQGASPQQWRTTTRTGASPQQCPTGTHTHNSRSGNMGQGTQEQAPIYSPLHNAPIKPHKPRKGAGVLGYIPPAQNAAQGAGQATEKGHKKKPRPQGAGICTFNFVSESQPTARTGKPAGIENPFFAPPHTNRKRRVSVVLVYRAAISGISRFNAVVSMRELVTAL